MHPNKFPGVFVTVKYIYINYMYIYMYVCIEGRKVLTVMTGGILQIHSPQHFALCLYGDSDRIQGMWF